MCADVEEITMCLSLCATYLFTNKQSILLIYPLPSPWTPTSGGQRHFGAFNLRWLQFDRRTENSYACCLQRSILGCRVSLLPSPPCQKMIWVSWSIIFTQILGIHLSKYIDYYSEKEKESMF